MIRWINRILAVALAIILSIGVAHGLCYILVDDTISYSRIMLHELYTSEENIDVAFVGSSHAFMSIVPEIADEGFDCYTFVAGTSNQRMDGSLAMVRELVGRYDVHTIYLEMYYGVTEGTPYVERSNMTETYILTDYMRPSLNKYSYLLHAGSQKYWLNGVLPARRYWSNIFEPEYVHDLLERKSAPSYKNYTWNPIGGDEEYYVERGYVANDAVVGDDIMTNAEAYVRSLESNDVSSDWLNSLQTIIDTCARNDVELRLFIAPQLEWTTAARRNYQEYHDMIQGIADKNGLSFYDFNFCKAEYLDTNDRSIFMDTIGHLNTKGARLFTTVLCNFYTGKIDADDLFYASWQDKMENEEPQIYGLAGPGIDQETNEDVYFIVSNRITGMRYRIEVEPDGGASYLLQDFNDNTTFKVPADEAGVIRITWYYQDPIDDVETIDIRY